jgi:hypothetical protein
LSFTYRGQLSTLRSAADIAAWLAERKRRYPTRAKAEEAARLKEKAFEADRLAREKRQKTARRRTDQSQERKKAGPARQENMSLGQKDKVVGKGSSCGEDAYSKTEAEAEGLRKKLAKTRKKLAKIEAKAAALERDQRPDGSLFPPKDAGNDDLRLGGTRSQDPNAVICETEVSGLERNPNSHISHLPDADSGGAQICDPLTPYPRRKLPAIDESGPRSLLDIDSSKPESLQTLNPLQTDSQNEESISETDDSFSSSSDFTSPSDSEADSDPRDDATSSTGTSTSSAPDEIPSKGTRLVHVSPPSCDVMRKRVCREFRATGRCRYGKNCRFSHGLKVRTRGPEGSKRRSRAKDGRPEKMSLYQRVS